MVTQGGLEQQMPPQAMVITLGLPFVSYEPTHQTGVGKISVLAPNDFFIILTPSHFAFGILFDVLHEKFGLDNLLT